MSVKPWMGWEECGGRRGRKQDPGGPPRGCVWELWWEREAGQMLQRLPEMLCGDCLGIELAGRFGEGISGGNIGGGRKCTMLGRGAGG